MTIQDLIGSGLFEVVNEGTETSREIRDVFCCDLLSIAMGRGIEDAAWVTVMGNINTLAVMVLTDMACIILAEGSRMEDAGIVRAQQEGFTILRTEEPVFTSALKIHEMIAAGK